MDENDGNAPEGQSEQQGGNAPAEGGNDDANTPEGQPGGVQESRRGAGSLLDGASDAIERALEGDSQSFIESSKQQGGE